MAAIRISVISKAFPTQVFPFFILLFILVNVPKFAHAQTKHVLIVEHLAKEKKPNLYWLGSSIVLLHQNDKQVAGTITSLTDSSIVLGRESFLLSNIKAVKRGPDGKDMLKFFGAITATVGSVLIVTGAILLADGFFSPKDQNAALLGISIPLATGLGYYAASQRPNLRYLGPETGWILRIKRIE